MFDTLCKALEEILGMDQIWSLTSRKSKLQQLFRHHLFKYFPNFNHSFMSFEALAVFLFYLVVSDIVFLFYQNAFILAGDFISLY